MSKYQKIDKIDGIYIFQSYKKPLRTKIHELENKICNLEKENEVLQKALELACNDILINVEYDCPDVNGDIGCPVGNKNNNFCKDCIKCEKIAEYIQQAKEELK